MTRSSRDTPRWLAFNAYALKNYNSFGRITEEVLRCLLQTGHGRELTVFTAPGACTERVRVLPRSGEASVVKAPPWAKQRILFEDIWLPGAIRRARSEVYFNVDFTIPFAYRGKGVVTIHDLSFWDMPHSISFHARLLYGFKVPGTARKASRLIAVSESTRNAILARGLAPKEKIVRIYNGVNREFKPMSVRRARAVIGNSGLTYPYVLGVGVIEPRKNWGIVAETLADPIHPLLQSLHFVLVGTRGRAGRTIQEGLVRRLPGRVHFLHSVERGFLRALYTACEAFVYPSLYEGFGLPVLEAMACGAPVITSNVTALPETAGKAGVLIDPRDPSALARALLRLGKDRSFRKSLRRRGLAHARKFSWESSVQQLWEVLRLVRRQR